MNIQHDLHNDEDEAEEHAVDLEAEVGPGLEEADGVENHLEGRHDQHDHEEDHEGCEGSVNGGVSWGGTGWIIREDVPIVNAVMITSVLHHVHGQYGYAYYDGGEVCDP